MMKKVIQRGIYSAIVSVGLLSIVLPAGAATTPAKKKDEKIWCPYMDLNVKKSKATQSSYKGKTYYFCCDDCKKMFDKDPAKESVKYTKKVAEHKKAPAKPKA